MKDVSTYLAWEKMREGARIVGRHVELQGVLAIPSLIEGVPVVEIGAEALETSLLASVDVPGSVEIIGRRAFALCLNLIEARLREGLKKIDPRAFYLCQGLVRVDIPNTVEVIDEEAFAFCPNLIEARLPSTVKKIGINAFDKKAILIVDAGTYAERWCVQNHLGKYKVC